METKIKLLGFDYDKAFSRNLGIFTEAEQKLLKLARIGIPGCGGVGGVHAMTLARMGVGNFTISDFDHYEIENFNRQAGARISTLHQKKVEVIRADIKDVNPEANVKIMSDGISEKNIGEFLDGLQLVIDSLDFFAIKARRLLFAEANRRGIPVITAGPLGLSSALIIFLPGKMTAEEYFGFKSSDSEELLAIKFALGLAPKGLHWPYILKAYVNLKEKRGPSSGSAVALCAAWASTTAAKILLNRGPVLPAPYYMQFDMYRSRFAIGRSWLGVSSPLYLLKLWLAKRMLSR